MRAQIQTSIIATHGSVAVSGKVCELNPFPLPPYFPYGFAISGDAWRRFSCGNLPGSLGKAERTQFVHAAQLMAGRLSPAMPDGHPARAGELLAMGLITEALRHMAAHYCVLLNPGVLDDAITTADAGAVSWPTVQGFVALYPPCVVHAGQMDSDDFLELDSAPLGGEALAALETLLLAVTNENPAMQPYAVLHDDAPLRALGAYPAFIEALERFFAAQPPHPQTRMTLLDMLRAPLRAAPTSLEAQLDFIRVRWAEFLPEDLFARLALARGILREEGQFRGHGPGPLEAMRFFGGSSSSGDVEYEAFSQDSDWMPNVVLVAKQTYVWLDQLEKKYGRSIHRLDQVPDEELDLLADWGFSGLWLIGLWERSVASRDIKRRMGNPEAEASAYSLYDYQVAQDLGGESAYHDLAARAWRRGIRLASDMVPNHVGIYSRWVLEHPDWFVQSPVLPYPTYQFTGPDLSHDPGMGLYIEDGYWSKSDAAVVFKRVDHGTGEVRYIYHGNDGTNMPWNDTAQLNFLMPEVREAVIQTVVHVARMFPIIRFDAAMTLAKKHFQRLWFPKPGDEGAVPSRAAHGMSREEFDQHIPHEFWREVVDRVAAEAPDTLLLAEAFWLMEGYFVRTLGMHRVYNSAFMNMLKMEENAKYRATLRNVLEFSPEVLQRFVNFMNNPDEDTAEAQFGRGDKYFGVCMLMATLPGLPMFGHGQIEGYTEKYGMEYRRAYRNEQPDPYLVARHEREIFPILHRRRIFSGAAHFALFDFIAPEGHVDENVYAYTNRHGTERALIFFHNAYRSTRGGVCVSVGINEGSADVPQLRQRGLGETLGLHASDTGYYILRDEIAGVEYLHHSRALCEHGLHTELGPYQCRVFLEWREVHDHDLSWGQLHQRLQGRGVASMAEAYKELFLRDVLDPFDQLMRPESLRGRLLGDDATEAELDRYEDALEAFYAAANARLGGISSIDAELSPMGDTVGVVMPEIDHDDLPCVLLQGDLRPLGLGEPLEAGLSAAAIVRDWLLAKHVQAGLSGIGMEEPRATDLAHLTVLLLEAPALVVALDTAVWGPVLYRLFESPEARALLRVHPFGGKRWLDRDQLHRFIGLVRFTLMRELAMAHGGTLPAETIAAAEEVLQTLIDAAGDCGYDFDGMLRVLT